MKPLLIVIDMQNDFISMALSTTEAQAIVSPVVSKIRSWDGPVLYTRDTHPDNYLETAEGKKLPVSHCIKGSIGWQLNDEIQACVVSDDQIIDKPTFGSLVLTDRVQQMAANHEISSITLVGLCTDICVISNALLLKAALWELPIAVDASCCAGVTVQSHNNALEAMKMCQIDIL
jgi:nicotinamidase/pyrazinamidase